MIFISTPFRAVDPMSSLHRNIAYAKSASLDSIARGEIPITPHLMYPTYLNDHNPAHRKFAMEACVVILAWCEKLAVYDQLGISEGMKAEIALAKEAGIPIEYRQTNFERRPAHADSAALLREANTTPPPPTQSE